MIPWDFPIQTDKQLLIIQTTADYWWLIILVIDKNQKSALMIDIVASDWAIEMIVKKKE